LAAAAVQHEEEEEDRKHTGQKVPQLQQQKAAQTSSGFVELPTELLRAILALLNARDLAACAVTSKLLGALAVRRRGAWGFLLARVSSSVLPSCIVAACNPAVIISMCRQ
jgi:hypothetical protein